MAEEPLDFVSAHVVEAQEALGRQILIENPSSYLRFPIPHQLERVLIRPPTGRPRPGSPASRINVCPIWTMIGPSTTRREPSADDAGCSGALSGGIHFSTTYRGPKGVHHGRGFRIHLARATRVSRRLPPPLSG